MVPSRRAFPPEGPGRFVRAGSGTRLFSVIVLAAILISTSACSFFRKPNLGKIYHEVDREKPPHPVILIPGFLGSKLKQKDTGRIAWGKMLDVLRGGRGDRFTLPITDYPLSANVDDLVAYGIYDNAIGSRYYGDILDALVHHGGYRRGDIRRPQPGENCFVFYFDWRRDMVEAAAQLGAAIENLKRVYGDPDLEVDLIAHSMGGLIARYYILYGAEDVLDGSGTPVPTLAGAPNVDRLILIGTPNQGSLFALETLDRGMKKVAEPVSVREVFTMPSLYEMLPVPGSAVLIDSEGRPLNIDLYDASNWEKYGWSVFGEHQGRKWTRGRETTLEEKREFLERVLERAGRFHLALGQSAEKPPDTRYFTFGSDCTPTLEKAVLLRKDSGRWELLFQERSARYDSRWVKLRETVFQPGDGVVTRESLLSFPERESSFEADDPASPFHYAYFLCETHGLLTRDVMFQNNLFYVLNHRSVYRRAGVVSGSAEGL
jgi:pimeloyl-ACP methyl ester carboxylesterase